MIALRVEAADGFPRELECFRADPIREKRLCSRKHWQRVVVPEFSEPIRRLVEHLKRSRQITATGDGTREIVVHLERSKSLFELVEQRFGFFEIRDRSVDISAAKPDSAAIRQYPSQVARRTLAAESGDGSIEEIERLRRTT